MVSNWAAQRNWSYLKGFILEWQPEQLNTHMVFAVSVSHLWSDLSILHYLLSLSLSVALVKRHAPIKCLPFQLFSSHVIHLLDYNPHLPPTTSNPQPSLSPTLHTGGQRLYSSRTGSIACNVFCHLSYVTSWLTWLCLIESLLAPVAHCPERIKQCNVTTTLCTARCCCWVKPGMADMAKSSSLITNSVVVVDKMWCIIVATC